MIFLRTQYSHDDRRQHEVEERGDEQPFPTDLDELVDVDARNLRSAPTG